MNEANFIGAIFESPLKFARSIATETPAVIFAFMWAVQYIKEWKREARDSDMSEKSIEARLAIAQALSAIAEKTEEHSDRINRIEVILDERLARRT